MLGIGLLSGAANVIMELARPGVGYGVKDSRVESGRADRHPIKRARTTFTYLAVALSGSETQKAAYRRAVNKSHAQVYSMPDSPVHTTPSTRICRCGSRRASTRASSTSYRIFVGEMDDESADHHYREGMKLGTTLQVPAEMWPADRKAFDEYWQQSLDQVHIDDAVRDYLYPIAAGRIARCESAPPLRKRAGRGEPLHHDRLSAATVPRRDGTAVGRGQAAPIQSSDGGSRQNQQPVAAVVRRFPFNWMLQRPGLADADRSPAGLGRLDTGRPRYPRAGP